MKHGYFIEITGTDEEKLDDFVEVIEHIAKSKGLKVIVTGEFYQ